MTSARAVYAVVAVMLCVCLGRIIGGLTGAVVGLLLALSVLVFPYRGLTMWTWFGLFISRYKTFKLAQPITVANDGAGGGVRYQDGSAVVAVQVLGKSHVPTIFTSAMSAQSQNTMDVRELFSLMNHSLGLQISSISVVVTGARRLQVGDYSRVYDTLIGTPPYAGRRETWLVIRLEARANSDALQYRNSVGAAAIAAAQRIVTSLRCKGIRARLATSGDIGRLEERLGCSALNEEYRRPGRRHPKDGRWRQIRSNPGWLTTYGYDSRYVTSAALAEAWSLRVDEVTQNLTLFSDETVAATITVRTPQPLVSPPSAVLQHLPGQQISAILNNLCGPSSVPVNVQRAPLTSALVVPVGPSGVLLGKLAGGDRIMLPLADPSEFTRISIEADDAMAKRLLIRLAASGDRITVHTCDAKRWGSVSMPNVMITKSSKPACGSTVSVIDGSVSPSPRPNTVVVVNNSDDPKRLPADIVIKQLSDAAITVTTADETFDVELELFRAENRYVQASLAGGFRQVQMQDEWVR